MAVEHQSRRRIVRRTSGEYPLYSSDATIDWNIASLPNSSSLHGTNVCAEKSAVRVLLVLAPITNSPGVDTGCAGVDHGSVDGSENGSKSGGSPRAARSLADVGSGGHGAGGLPVV